MRTGYEQLELNRAVSAPDQVGVHGDGRRFFFARLRYSYLGRRQPRFRHMLGDVPYDSISKATQNGAQLSHRHQATEPL